jgi:DNA primase catalytic subunit
MTKLSEILRAVPQLSPLDQETLRFYLDSLIRNRTTSGRVNARVGRSSVPKSSKKKKGKSVKGKDPRKNKSNPERTALNKKRRNMQKWIKVHKKKLHIASKDKLTEDDLTSESDKALFRQYTSFLSMAGSEEKKGESPSSDHEAETDQEPSNFNLEGN